MANTSLDATLKIMGQVNTALPIILALSQTVKQMFIDQTPELTNAERIELLRRAGMLTMTEADAWLKEHPETPTPDVPSGG
jgi:UDP-N-acetylglucosamine enolpyruvyl transferase